MRCRGFHDLAGGLCAWLAGIAFGTIWYGSSGGVGATTAIFYGNSRRCPMQTQDGNSNVPPLISARSDEMLTNSETGQSAQVELPGMPSNDAAQLRNATVQTAREAEVAAAIRLLRLKLDLSLYDPSQPDHGRSAARNALIAVIEFLPVLFPDMATLPLALQDLLPGASRPGSWHGDTAAETCRFTKVAVNASAIASMCASSPSNPV